MLRKIWIIVALLTMAVIAWADDTSVRGYWRDSDRDGVKDTYVDSYRRTKPNDSLRDNYGYPGNYNPNRGGYSTGNPDTYERSHRQKNTLGW